MAIISFAIDLHHIASCDVSLLLSFRLQMVSVENKLFTIGGLRDVCVRDPLVPFVERFSGQKNTWDAIDHQPAVQDVELDSFCVVFTGRGSVLMTGGAGSKDEQMYIPRLFC